MFATEKFQKASFKHIVALLGNDRETVRQQQFLGSSFVNTQQYLNRCQAAVRLQQWKRRFLWIRS
jgi:hypothetical protein